MAESKDKKILSTILKIIVFIAISFVCILTIFLLYYVINSQIHADDESYKPSVSIYTIVSPSMTPVINVYDVVINVAVDNPKSLEVGDIITYKSQASNSEGMTITHRIIAIDQLPDGTYEYLTQGDNNSEPDSLYVTFDNVIGKEIAIIPGLGRLQFLIANHKWWLIILIIPIAIYLVREILKLIDLFNLRNKVDRVTGAQEPSVITKKKIENEARKERIKEEIECRELERDSLTKNKLEPSGFLEKYSETIVSVPYNKYDKKNRNKIANSNKIDEVEEMLISEKTIKPTIETISKEIEEIKEIPKKEEIVNEQYEILDTDELSSKIKQYDSKILQLDKMIKDMENIASIKKEEHEVEERENDDFLQGNRIKVIKVELTNNNEEVKKERRKSKEEKISLGNIKTTSINPNKTITRPNSKDIKELRNEINKELKVTEKTVNIEPKKQSESKKGNNKNRLNLNPKTVKKVTRSTRKKNQRNLNLNPQNVKKVRRPKQVEEEKIKQASRQKTIANQQEQVKKESSKRRNKLISIEKIK